MHALPIGIAADKVTTAQQWRNGSHSWRTTVRKAALSSPRFVLHCDGSGTLFYRDGDRVRQRTWGSVRVIHPAT